MSAPVHGGQLDALIRRFGGERDDWIDVSTGIAPYAYPVPAVPAECWQRLSHPTAPFLAAASAYYGTASLLPVAGSQAAICALPQLRARSRVGVLRASYAEHGWRWRVSGHDVVLLDAHNIDTAIEALDVLVLVNPNNPDGRIWQADVLLGWHERLARHGGWLVVDEAFIDALAPAASSLCPNAARAEGLIVLRSVGKFFGLAGARLGFVCAHPALLTALEALIGPWSVAGPALWAGEHALGDAPWQAEQRVRLQDDARWLRALLAKVGLAPAGQHPLMQFCPTDLAHPWHEELARERLYCRLFTCESIGFSALRFGPVHQLARTEFESRLNAAVRRIQTKE
ncbi:threonine-phosphate decarboxylase CobD [Chitinibacteraceae bacterium HSL-7]